MRTGRQGDWREEKKCSEQGSMENPPKAANRLHHVADCSRPTGPMQTFHRGLTSENFRPYIASVSCGDSPAYACGVCALKFSLSVFSLEIPYPDLCVPRWPIQTRRSPDFNTLLAGNLLRNELGQQGRGSRIRGERSRRLGSLVETKGLNWIGR